MSEFIKELLEKSKRGYTSRFIRIIKDEEKENDALPTLKGWGILHH